MRTFQNGDASALLLLEDGTSITGGPFGAIGHTVGEVVFATGMTGYQESLTDPSYYRQILIQTAPHIGVTGWHPDDSESHRIWVSGYAVREPSHRPSNWRSTDRIEERLRDASIVGIRDIDTRMVVRHLRERGPMRGGIFSGATLPAPEDLLARVRSAPPVFGLALSSQVTTDRTRITGAVGRRRFRVAALDLGIKASLLRVLADRGVESHLMPAHSTTADVLSVEPDGILLSNGPGDPSATPGVVVLIRDLLRLGIPLLGVCLGHQLLGRALGISTYKMRHPHRGINTPVVDLRTGRVLVTSHNHGFALSGEPDGRFNSEFGEVEVSHHCPDDGTIEGLRCLDVPAFSVQFHPEAAAGPHDSEPIFDEFCTVMAGRRFHAQAR